ncbi:MAG: hypothetical protein IJ169_04865 [Paludibacteraceae bacterium]|nr:hypothetical protein [Paludibacteraceae bacterium]
MALYKNIDVDFVERTKENLTYIEDCNVQLPQEITHLLNCCYGLLVLPEQKMADIITLMPQDLSFYGIDKESISTHRPKTFVNFITSMRNGFAHAHLQSLAEDGKTDFVALAIMDYAADGVKNGTYHTRIELSIPQLKNFILKFSQEYLRCKNQIENKS